MARKLFVMLAATALTVMPLSVNALGFGNIRVNSALNERMGAEIDLIGATEADIKDLKVSLASHNAFLRAGIERSAPLLGLRFSISRRSNGNYYIKVSSRNNVREPFLNFLLEMNWKNGRMLREYTVLLDPPDRMQRQPTVVAAPQTQAPASVAKEEQMAEAKQETPFIPAPMPAPVVKPEPMAAPVVEAEADDGQPFPRTDLTEYKEKDSKLAEAPVVAEPKVAAVEPEPVIPPAPEPAPEMEPLIPELEPTAKPGKAEPTSEMMGLPADSGKPLDQPAPAEEKSFDVAIEPPFEEVDQMYPTIPLSAYTDDAATDMSDKIPADETMADAAPVTGDLDYGITRKGDSLWKIAEKLRGDGSVTIHQVMMALLKSNPTAFINGNVHRMKVGQVLRIEDSSLLTAMSSKQAAQEYMAQTDAWNDYRQQVAAVDTAVQPEMASDTGAITQEEAPAEPAGELVLAAPESSELTAGVGTSEGKAAPSGTSDADLLREEVRKALAEAKTEQGRNTELNEHLRELEGELGNLQRSMSVQDDELAALQQQLSDLNAQEAPAPAAEQMPAAEQAPDLVAQPEMTTEPETAAAPETMETPAESTGTETVAGDLTAESGLAARQEEIQVPPAPPVEVIPPEPGFMDKAVSVLGGVVATVGGAVSTLSIDPIYLGIVGGVVVLLLVLTVIIVKRRKSGGTFQESILSGAMAGGDAAEAAETAGSPAAAEPASLDTNFSEESSFLSDFAISGAGAIQAEDSEVDPLTEADVFMAYGRHEAAEERLNEAVKQEPNRKELKLKLLELYNTTKNRESFEPLAEEFYASLGDSAVGDPMWEKVLLMGAEIAPENPLFGNAPEAASMSQQEEDFSDISNASMSDSQVMDIGLDTGVFNTGDFESPATPADMPDEESSAALDFNLDFGDADASSEESTASMDFNLGDDDETSTMKAPAASDVTSDEEGEETANIDLGAGMDFNLDSSEVSEDAADPTMTMQAPDLGDDDMSLDFDAGSAADESTASIDFDMGDATPAEAEASEPASEEFSLDLAGEDSAAGMDLNLDATDAAGMDDIGAVDEVGTKLDLAKAYIDMGDPEGARSILDEVMDEGNDSQKQEAQQLIQQIV